MKPRWLTVTGADVEDGALIYIARVDMDQVRETDPELAKKLEAARRAPPDDSAGRDPMGFRPRAT